MSELTLANYITLTRIALTPFFLTCLAYEKFPPALAFFAASIVTDWLDGYVARRRRPTNLGSFLDPLADKLMLIPAYVILAQNGRIPKWLFVLMLSRDFSIVLGWILYLAREFEFRAHARASGKLAIGAQMIYILLLLGGLAFPDWNAEAVAQAARWGAYAVGAFSFFSFVDYTVAGSRVFLAETAPDARKKNPP
jgi:cardiolipin synthase